MDSVRVCAMPAQTANVFTFSDIVKTIYSAIRIVIAADGSVKVDTTDKKFATSTFRSYPVKSYLVALNYASVATCAPLTAPGTGSIEYQHSSGIVACLLTLKAYCLSTVLHLASCCRCNRPDWHCVCHQG